MTPKERFIAKHPKAICCRHYTVYLHPSIRSVPGYQILSATGGTAYGEGKTERQAWANAARGMK